MYDHCKKILLLLVILIGTLPLPAASLRWVHLGAIDSGMAVLAIDGKIAYRKMPPGKATPWGKVTPGSHRFQISSGKNEGAVFELEIAEGQKITLVSVTDKNGNIQCRTFGLDEARNGVFVLNMLPGAAMGLPESKKKVIFGKGFWLPDDEANTTISLGDGAGFSAQVDFARLGDKPKGRYLAVICSNSDSKPSLAILRDRDSLFEMSAESIAIPGELEAGIKIISEGMSVAAGRFDPARVNWEEVKSRIFWLNLAIDRKPCRLEIRGFPAMRRMPAGRGSGFVKWPAGDWETDVVAEGTNAVVAKTQFSLSAKASLGLISYGGGKYPHRLLTLEGRPLEIRAPATSQIRFVNALPDGVLRSVVQYDPDPITKELDPGEVGEILPLVKGGFSGAALDFTLGAAKNQVIAKIPPMPSLPPGDWVVVIHLDRESFASPVLTWVEMDKGTITSPPSPGGDD